MWGVKAKEILLVADNRVGLLEEVTRVIKDSEINIRAISAWVAENKAFFRLITSNNAKTREILQSIGNVEENEVIIVDMLDETGKLYKFCSKLKDANIDLLYLYGTTSEPGKSAIVVFSAKDNDKALEIISA